ncbi:MAG TPA: response regulator [Syntrophomonadaceae bacterium]|nr:response regulator [Syntrophomonadaceae bacterium]
MIVDDEKPCLDELEYLLLKHNDIVITGAFTNPLEALAAAESSMPDAIFLDIGMPHVSGIEFAKRVYGYDETVQLVFVTAYTKLLTEVKKVWPFESILKPVSGTKLNIIVERLRRRLNPGLDK